MCSTLRITLLAAVLFSAVAHALPFESSALRALKQFGASAEAGGLQAQGWNSKTADDLHCGILRYWDLPNVAPDLVLSTSYSMIGILAGLNANLKPQVDSIWTSVAQHLTSGESCPLPIIEPHLGAITRLIEEATARMEHVPRIPASRRLDPLPKETCAEFVDLTYVFGSIPELLPNILSLVGLMGGITRLCGNAASIEVVGQSLTNLAVSTELAVPGIQLLVAADPISPGNALRARALGFSRLAGFLFGL